MRYGSVCSGIEAATVAWHPLGWRPAFFSEIAAFPRAVLAHHYPAVPVHGDFTTMRGDEYGAIDLLVGGTPCQDGSVAGKRAGLDGDNGRLTLEFAPLARRARARWLVWENVPGTFSLNAGADFGRIIADFAGHAAPFTPPADGWRNAGIVPAASPDDYGLCWRVLDARYFGVPQRRRRIFVVGYLGDWRRAAAVLLERESLQGNPPTRGEPPQDITAGALRSTDGGSDVDHARAGHLVAYGGNNTSGAIEHATACNAHGIRQDFETETFIVHAFDARQSDVIQYGDKTGPLDCDGGSAASRRSSAPPHAARVRRLTPLEWERLQGFPDGYTAVPYRGKPAADGPRYEAIGNSMPVPVMRWIGERIALVERLTRELEAAA